MQLDDNAAASFIGHQSPEMSEYHAIIQRQLKGLIFCVSTLVPGRQYRRFVKPLFEKLGTQEWIAIEIEDDLSRSV